MANVDNELDYLMSDITPAENLLPEPVSKIVQKSGDIEANRRLKHAAIAQASQLKIHF